MGPLGGSRGPFPPLDGSRGPISGLGLWKLLGGRCAHWQPSSLAPSFDLFITDPLLGLGVFLQGGSPFQRRMKRMRVPSKFCSLEINPSSSSICLLPSSDHLPVDQMRFRAVAFASATSSTESRT